MHINPQELSALESHHMLRNLVMPRPIALVSDELCHDGQPDCLGMKILGRLGDDYYQGVREPFVMERLKYDEWRHKQ